MAAASLVVKISADINDFSKQLNKLTKDVEKAADKIAGLGQAMTLGITVPVAFATVALSKMAVENDRVAKQFDRSFGPAAKRAHDQVLALGAVIPKTNTELEEASIYLNNFAKGLGFSAPQAAQLSVELMKMAADLAGFSGKTFEEALGGLEKGLMGSTKGLKSMGVALTAAQVEQEAYRLGLLGIGQELTPVGTAMATYSLLAKQAANWTGEAAKIAESAEGQWKMVGRDFLQLADDASNVLIPALMSLARVLQEFVSWLREIPSWLVKLVAGLVGFAAVMGPTIFLVAQFIKYMYLLKVAIGLLAGASGLAGLVGVLAAPQVVGALVLIAGAVGALVLVWRAFNKEAGKTPTPEDLAPPIDIRELMKLGGNDATAMDKGNPLQQLQQRASLAQSAFDMAISSGDRFQEQLERVVDVQKEAYRIWEKSADKFGEMSQGALKLYFQMKEIAIVSGVAFGGKSAGAASNALMPQTAIDMNVARSLIDETTQLRTREAAMAIADDFDAARYALVAWKEDLRSSGRDLNMRFQRLLLPDTFDVTGEAFVKAGENRRSIENDLSLRETMLSLPDGFQAVRLAAVELAEGFREAGNRFQLGIATLQKSWSSPKIVGEGAMAGFGAAISGATSSLTPMMIVLTLVNKVLEGFQPLLTAVLEPLVVLGRILAIIAGPVMRPVFEAFKVLGIVTAFLGEIISRVSASLLHVVAAVIKGIAKLIGWIPGLGGVEKKLKKFGDYLDDLGDDAQAHADALKKARSDLEHMKFGDTADDVLGLGDAARSATEALLNVPTGFKIAMQRFIATLPITLPNGATPPPAGPASPPGSSTPPASGGGSSGGGSSGGEGGDDGTTFMPAAQTMVQLVVDSRVLGTAVLENLQRKSQAKYGTTLRWSEVQA